MAPIRRRPAAKADLIDIYRYIAETSPDRAASYLKRIEEKLHLIAGQPGIGTRRLPNLPELRAFPVGSHLLFYLPLPEGGIDLVRVLHGARDWQRLMGG